MTAPTAGVRREHRNKSKCRRTHCRGPRVEKAGNPGSENDLEGTPRLLVRLAAYGGDAGVPASLFGKAFHMDDPLFIWTARHIRIPSAGFLRV